MIHGAGTLSQIKHGCQSAGDISFCALHCGIQIIAFCQIGGNSAGQRTSGTMGIRVVDPFTIEPFIIAVPVQKVVGII